MKALITPFIALAFGSLACHPTSSTQSLSSEDGKWRPVAEYEETKALLMATGWTRSSLAFIKPGQFSERSEKLSSQADVEFERMIDIFLQTQPQLKIYLNAYLEEKYLPGQKSEFELWLPLVEKWRQEGKDIELFEVDKNRYPGVSTGDLSDDSWTRDYGAFSLRTDDGKRALVARQGRGRYVNETVAARMNQDTHITSDIFYEGGRLTTNSYGECATSVHSGTPHLVNNIDELDMDQRFLKNDLYCKNIYVMPGLPNEGTGHIDLFAKIVGDRTLVLSQYESDDVMIERFGYETSYRCDDAALAAKDWYSCQRLGQRDVVLTNDGMRVTGEADFAAFLHAYDPDLKANYQHGKLRDHLKGVETLFLKAGFQLVKVTNPAPTLSLAVELYQDSKGQIVHKESSLNFTHRSYTNSLLANGQLYLPVYEGYEALNAAATKAYEGLGFIVHEVDMTATITHGGAVHCLTKELH